MKFFKKIRSLIATDKEVIKALEKTRSKQMELNKRLEQITIATLDGEWEWWCLRLKKIDSNCILKAIDKCEEDKEQ